MSTAGSEIRSNLRHNFIVNLFDGGFFGFALGFASFMTIIPLFVSRMTSSAILIGLVPAIHNVGWQAPQLLTASWVSRLRRYKPMVMLLTVHERVPFLGLALVAWFSVSIGRQSALAITFLLLIWQGLGGGITANPWLSMISKLIPDRMRGTFFGFQAAAANVLASISAILAGLLLDRLAEPLNFTACFLLASLAMVVSFFSLNMTREPVDNERPAVEGHVSLWHGSLKILRQDSSFRAFLLVRTLSQFAVMGFAFYSVYAVKSFELKAITAGVLTSVFMIAQIIANPLMGWLGDRWGHKRVMLLGIIAALVSSVLAGLANSLIVFYPVFILAGLANVAIWTITMAMTVDFGTPELRPTYIGLSNTLAAPAAILAPLLGGFLADLIDYKTTFYVSAIGGFLTVLVLYLMVKEPRNQVNI